MPFQEGTEDVEIIQAGGIRIVAKGEPGAVEYVAVSHSYAAQLGHFLEPVTRPMGLDWRGGVAMICGFAAREVFVSAMALMYRIDDAGGKGDGLADRSLARMGEVRFEDSGARVFTISSVLGVILFFMIALQCFSTVAVSKAESGGLEAGRGPTRALHRDRLRADGGPGPGPAGPGRPVIPRFSFLPPAPEPIFGSESRGRRHYP